MRTTLTRQLPPHGDAPRLARGRALAARRAARAACAVVVAAALAGCQGTTEAVDDSSGTTRFVAGDGTGTYYQPGDRHRAPVLEGKDLDGQPLSTARFAGRTYVVNVWGSWCAPCVKEQPGLERAAREMRSLDVAFVGINVRDPSPVAARRHVKRHQVSYPSFYDPASQLVARFRDVPATAIPSTFVVDRQGRVAARVLGGVEYDALISVVRRVAGERG